GMRDRGRGPDPPPGADRKAEEVVCGGGGQAEPADEISGAVDSREALVHRPGAWQVVDQHHGAGALAAGVETDGRTLPIDPQVSGILGIEHPLAVTQSRDKSAARFLPEDVTIGEPPKADRFLDDLGEPPRDRAKELMAGIDEFARSKSAGLRGRRRRLLRRKPGNTGAGKDEHGSYGPQDGSHRA